MPIKNKVIAIVGTTASGKTNLAVDLCLNFDGEVVSADSRQVYKYLDIGSGKDLAEYTVFQKNGRIKKIPYHLIDVVAPNEEFDLAKWLNNAKIAVDDIVNRKKIPVVAGGTGLYVQALIDGYNLSQASTDKILREKLEQFSETELFEKLKILNSKITGQLNNSERNNKRRLIRLIEILKNSKRLPISNKMTQTPYDSLILGLTLPREELRKRILNRIVNRLDNEAMVNEVELLHIKHHVSWERLGSFGLEYRYISSYLKGEISYNEMVEKLHIATCQFAKRQMSWLRRWEKQGATIHWIDNKNEAREIVKNFLAQKDV